MKYKTGFYEITNEQHHADKKILSSSGIPKLLTSPAHFQEYCNSGNDPTKAMIFGSAFHAAILEPDKYLEQVAIAQDINKRTKAGKEEYAAFQELSKGKVIIGPDEDSQIKKMKAAVCDHEAAAELLKKGKAELSGFWTDYRGFQCKIRPDWLPGGGICVDLKSTEDASPEGFMRSAYKYNYHTQAAFYLRGLTAITGIEHTEFVFIAVEKKPPYGVAVYYASPEMIEFGNEKIDQALDIYAECLKTNYWPCYSGKPEELNLPRWAA